MECAAAGVGRAAGEGPGEHGHVTAPRGPWRKAKESVRRETYLSGVKGEEAGALGRGMGEVTNGSGRVEKQEQGSRASPSRCTIQCKKSSASDAGEEDSINSGRCFFLTSFLIGFGFLD